jgi:hypothetical protein
MHMVLSILAFSIAQAIAKDVPSNLAAFLIKVKADGPCNDPFPGSFYDIEGGSKCMFSISQTISQTSGLFSLTTFSLPLLQRRRHHLSERTKRQTSQHGRGLRRLEEFAVPGSCRLRHSVPHFIRGLCPIKVRHLRLGRFHPQLCRLRQCRRQP